MASIHKIGAVDKQIMRRFDKACSRAISLSRSRERRRIGFTFEYYSEPEGK